jgi:hypothetical protein
MSDFKFRINARVRCEYDFGDCWQHSIRVEARLLLEKKHAYPSPASYWRFYPMPRALGCQQASSPTKARKLPRHPGRMASLCPPLNSRTASSLNSKVYLPRTCTPLIFLNSQSPISELNQWLSNTFFGANSTEQRRSHYERLCAEYRGARRQE